MAACGLDFGTSNTTLGTTAGGRAALAPLEGEHLTIPSAIFYEWSGTAHFGRAAMQAYVDGIPGRLMRSLKSVLGSALLNEVTQVGRTRVSFKDVIGTYIGEVKRRAEAATGSELTAVVHGRPVHFVDGNPDADRKAEDALRAIAHAIGFKDVSFQFEPIAAAFDYENQIGREEIALIADIGGGTSDFSIVRIGPQRHNRSDRSSDILANDGIRVGGTDYDRQLSLGTVMPLLGFRSPMKRRGMDVPSSYFHELATWSAINRLYTDKTLREIQDVRREAAKPELVQRLFQVIDGQRGHTLAIEVEEAKITLSDAEEAQIPLEWLEPGLAARLGRDAFIRQSEQQTSRIAERIGACLKEAGLRSDQVDALFLTGGTTRIPHVREAIVAAAPGARVVEGDTFGSVGTGLTIEALRRYGIAAAA